MFLRIVLGHNHQENTGTGNNSVGLQLSSATHPPRHVNKTDYCVTFMHSSWLPAIWQRIEKTLNENYV